MDGGNASSHLGTWIRDSRKARKWNQTQIGKTRSLRADFEWQQEVRVRGAADLVLESEDSLVLIDHKCLEDEHQLAADKAARYGGQLRAYAVALAAAFGKPVAHSFIHLPVAGLAVELSLTSPDG